MKNSAVTDTNLDPHIKQEIISYGAFGRYDATETKQNPVGSWAPIFVCREQTPASMTFFEFQRANSSSCSSREGGDAETREEPPKNKSAALWWSSDSTQRDTQNNISELFFPVVMHGC